MASLVNPTSFHVTWRVFDDKLINSVTCRPVIFNIRIKDSKHWGERAGMVRSSSRGGVQW